MRFIPPARPTLRFALPRGDQWVHEVKFDGWRVQLHKHERGVTIFTSNGLDFTHRLPAIEALVASLPARSCIIDGELTTCDERGLPHFRALHFRDVHDDALYVWAFDILHFNGEDLRHLPLVTRKLKLERFVYRVRNNWLRLSESFDEGVKLFASCAQMGLEGTVSKHRDAPYRSGRSTDWIKVKCASCAIPTKTAGTTASDRN